MPSFHDLLGQDRPITILQAMLQTANPPQAMLFSGDEGIGKQTAAMIFAQTLLCRNPTQEKINPCNTCLSCTKMMTSNHPDFFKVAPIEGETIKIDALRDLTRPLVFPPIESRWKVILLAPAEKMTPEAQNSLLKALEEPPPYVVWILIAATPTLLVPPLLSRCQKISFSPLSFSQVEQILIERNGWTAQDARLVAAITGGKLGEALSLSVEEARQTEETYNRLVALETLVHYNTLFETAAAFSKEIATFERALFYLSAYLRDILVLLAVPHPTQLDSAYLVFSWRQPELLEWARRMDTYTATKLMADMTALQKALVRNINRQLALETLLMQMRDKCL